MVESELIQHVFEILDSDWLCDEVTSITTEAPVNDFGRSATSAKKFGRM